MKFFAAISSVLLAATALAAPSPGQLEKRSNVVSEIVTDVLDWCEAQGTLCDKVCSVGVSILAGRVIPFAGGLIGPIYCASMKYAVICATNPADPACENVGEAILAQTIQNLGITPAQYGMIKQEVDELHQKAKEAAEKAAQEAEEAARKAKELADKAAEEAKQAAEKAKKAACKVFGC